MQLVIDTLTELWFAIVILHDVETRVDGLFVLQREYEPATQQATSHRTYRLVDDIEQRLAIILHGMNQFETANRELIEAYILIFLDARDAGDMTNLGVLCLFEILQDSTSCDDTRLQMIHTKAF